MAKEKEFVREIADIETDFAQWYTDVVTKTELVDYGPVKGTMVIGKTYKKNWTRDLKLQDTATHIFRC